MIDRPDGMGERAAERISMSILYLTRQSSRKVSRALVP